MKILFALTYFRPHVSGLTIYVDRLSQALARRGHQVAVLTSQYLHDLPEHEVVHDVEIFRVPVAFRLSKGVIMPGFGRMASKLVRENDALSLHLPQFDAAGLAVRGRLYRKPTVLTYHCDLRLPTGVVNFFANRAVHLANHLAAQMSHRIVAYTQDYAENSPFISRYLDKVTVIPPPVQIADHDPVMVESLQNRRKNSAGPLIGMAARLATEKGVEYLLDALPEVIQRFPDAEVFFAGQHEEVLGEATYAASLASQLDQLQDHWTFLGVLSAAEMRAFYELCDVTVLPSINSTESFGLVQIESMMCGTPVVASNLPGVRQPIQRTGMGVVVPIQDGQALASALIQVLESPTEFVRKREEIEVPFQPDSVAELYEELFRRLQTELVPKPQDG